MTDNAGFTGNIPEHYDQGLGPILFVQFADDIARRVAAYAPKRVLETAAGTGIVTRCLFEHLPKAEILATDLNENVVEAHEGKSTEDPLPEVLDDHERYDRQDHVADEGVLFIVHSTPEVLNRERKDRTPIEMKARSLG